LGGWIAFTLALLVSGSALGAPPSESSSEPTAFKQEAGVSEPLPAGAAPELEKRNAELLKSHAEIWELMSLSPKAQAELNDIVVSINTSVHKNRAERPEAFEKATAIQRSDKPLTYEAFLSSHKRRFSLLEISASTQGELLTALDFTWKSLHDPEAPEERREAAEKVRDLMKSMGGPPPCCDDSIFERAGMAH
jgi:hypothetical protein